MFDKTFIYDSYSCRINKGTHKAVKRLAKFTRQVSKNYKGHCWVLKCDIKKFFASVDHGILLTLLRKKVKDENVFWLLEQVINSFCKGIPLGNLTSQVFANIYLNELDQFVKHKLKIKYYMRYADDFILVSSYKDTLQRSIVPIAEFLRNNLKLELHPDKITFRKLEWGIDFLGYIVLPYYVLPRTKTKRRMFKKLKIKVDNFNNGKILDTPLNQTLASYLGFLKHANSFRVSEELRDQIWFWTGGS